MDPVLLIVTLFVDLFLSIEFWSYLPLLLSDVNDDTEIVVKVLLLLGYCLPLLLYDFLEVLVLLFLLLFLVGFVL